MAYVIKARFVRLDSCVPTDLASTSEAGTTGSNQVTCTRDIRFQCVYAFDVPNLLVGDNRHCSERGRGGENFGSQNSVEECFRRNLLSAGRVARTTYTPCLAPDIQ
jgi:hypothetical protein